MKISSLVLPTIAAASAAILLWPSESQGYSTIGGSLSLTQRDFRLFNNFTNVNANNNVTPDANWPGYDGAEMATWKGGGEWASQLHGGNGAGDTQLNGSGGANFDFSWQGNANAIGGTNDNILSEIAGSNGGVLAYTETPISDGWRQRYYQNWTWQDGPTNPVSGIDIEGVVVHELGHSLGLGHSTVGGATMFPSISGTGAAARSIEADDIAGVQFIYGVKSATKPTITSITVLGGGQIQINGTNFSATNNEVWFTNDTVTAPSGSPVIKATGVASTGGGTQITVTVPVNGGAGDVHVKSSAGSTGAFLSNGFPADVTAPPPCGAPTIYCTAKLLSTGGVAFVSYTGSNSLAINDLYVQCNTGVPNKTGVPYYSATQAALPFMGGFLCAQPPVQRGAPFTFDIVGFTEVAWPIDVLKIGTSEFIGFWFRDPANLDGTFVGLSDAIEVPHCP